MRRLLKWLDSAPNHWPIALHLTLVAVRRVEDLGVTARLEAAAAESKKFWAAVGIRLRVNVRGLAAEVDPTVALGDTIRRLHLYRVGSQPPTVYVLNDSERLEGKFLGLAYSSGLAVVAGIVETNTLDEIIDHELGHLLLGSEHEEGTFMAPILELHNRTVTAQQRKALRHGALKYRTGQ